LTNGTLCLAIFGLGQPFYGIRRGRSAESEEIRRKPGGVNEMNGNIIENTAKRRFEMALGDELAVAYYRVEDARIVLLHTEVPQHFSGRGFGSQLAHGVFEIIRGRGQRVIAKCPFMAAYASRHPEYAAMLDG
jgi:predicted GNAT family acetyltransferase